MSSKQPQSGRSRSSSSSTSKRRASTPATGAVQRRLVLYAVIGTLSLLWMLVHVRILRLSALLPLHHSSKQQLPHAPYNPNKPLNILLLYGDDWRYDSLGIAPGSVVQTPFLDQLARGDNKGIWFTHACVTTSVCWISRASLHTGQYYRRHESHDTDHPHWYREWNTSTFPALLRKAGWYVGHVGKWNWKYWREIIRKEYDYAQQYEGYHWYAVPTATTTTSSNNQHQKNPKPKRIHTTKRNQRDAIEFLQTRPKDRPFLLTVAFFAPHAEDTNPLQYLPQPKSMNLYQNQTIPLPPLEGMQLPHNLDHDSLQHEVEDAATIWPPPELPPFFNERNIGRQRWRRRFETPQQYQTMMKNYYRLITEVDAACQRIVAEIEAQGILEQTLIIFTTDNGYFHAEHGLADKWYPHQPSIRVPLIIRDPRRTMQNGAKITSSSSMQQQQQQQQQQQEATNTEVYNAPLVASSSTSAITCDAFVLNVDVAPTILRAANLTVPSRMQGFDLATLYLTDSDETSPICGLGTSTNADSEPTPTTWRQEFFYEHPKLMDDPYSIPASEAVVRKDWKYVEWPDFGRTQLFDLQRDPWEFHDVSSNPQHATLLQEMRERHAELKQQLE